IASLPDTAGVFLKAHRDLFPSEDSSQPKRGLSLWPIGVAPGESRGGFGKRHPSCRSYRMTGARSPDRPAKIRRVRSSRRFPIPVLLFALCCAACRRAPAPLVPWERTDLWSAKPEVEMM